MKTSHILESVLRPDDDHEKYTGEPNSLDDPEVLIPGYGGLKLSTVQKKIVERIEAALEAARSGQWPLVDHYIRASGVLPAMTQTVVDAIEELESSKSSSDEVIKKNTPKR